MASPQSVSSQDALTKNKPEHEQVTFRFCSECSNMLYPKEDEENHKLQFTCRTCFYTEDAATTCVFRNVLNTSAGETAGVTQDVGSDPTVSSASDLHPHTPVVCLMCGHVIACVTCGDTMDVDLARMSKEKDTKDMQMSLEDQIEDTKRRKEEERERIVNAQTLDELLAASSSPLGFDENEYDSMDLDDEYDAWHSDTSDLFGDDVGMTIEL